MTTAFGSTGRFRRTHGQSPHVLMAGAAESAPWAESGGGTTPFSVVRSPAGLRHCVLERRQEVPSLVGERFRSRSRRHAPARAHEERDPEACLERSYGSGEWRPGHPETERGPAQVPLVEDRQEVAQVAKLDSEEVRVDHAIAGVNGSPFAAIPAAALVGVGVARSRLGSTMNLARRSMHRVEHGGAVHAPIDGPRDHGLPHRDGGVERADGEIERV